MIAPFRLEKNILQVEIDEIQRQELNTDFNTLQTLK